MTEMLKFLKKKWREKKLRKVLTLLLTLSSNKSTNSEGAVLYPRYIDFHQVSLSLKDQLTSNIKAVLFISFVNLSIIQPSNLFFIRFIIFLPELMHRSSFLFDNVELYCRIFQMVSKSKDKLSLIHLLHVLVSLHELDHRYLWLEQRQLLAYAGPRSKTETHHHHVQQLRGCVCPSLRSELFGFLKYWVVVEIRPEKIVQCCVFDNRYISDVGVCCGYSIKQPFSSTGQPQGFQLNPIQIFEVLQIIKIKVCLIFYVLFYFLSDFFLHLFVFEYFEDVGCKKRSCGLSACDHEYQNFVKNCAIG